MAGFGKIAQVGLPGQQPEEQVATHEGRWDSFRLKKWDTGRSNSGNITCGLQPDSWLTDCFIIESLWAFINLISFFL